MGELGSRTELDGLGELEAQTELRGVPVDHPHPVGGGVREHGANPDRKPDLLTQTETHAVPANADLAHVAVEAQDRHVGQPHGVARRRDRRHGRSGCACTRTAVLTGRSDARLEAAERNPDDVVLPTVRTLDAIETSPDRVEFPIDTSDLPGQVRIVGARRIDHRDRTTRLVVDLGADVPSRARATLVIDLGTDRDRASALGALARGAGDVGSRLLPTVVARELLTATSLAPQLRVPVAGTRKADGQTHGPRR